MSNTKTWQKGNLHAHTTVSDGSLQPEVLIEMYRAYGYDFLCISDHDVYSAYPDEEDFLLLPGMEASSAWVNEKGYEIQTHHVGAVYAPFLYPPKETWHHLEKRKVYTTRSPWNTEAEMKRLIQEVHDHGCLAIYNHPKWSRIGLAGTQDNPADLIEVYNYNTQIESREGYDESYYDACLASGNVKGCTASDDNHNRFQDSFGGFVMVKAPLEREAIVQALAKGQFYSSSGLLIKALYKEGDHLRLVCDGCTCDCVSVVAYGPVGSSYCIREPGVSDIKIPIYNPSFLMRLVIKGKTGSAWTGPFVFDTFKGL